MKREEKNLHMDIHGQMQEYAEYFGNLLNSLLEKDTDIKVSSCEELLNDFQTEYSGISDDYE